MSSGSASLAGSQETNLTKGRHALREEIRRKDFYDENGTLIPNAQQVDRQLRPSRHLDNALEFRRRYNKERKQKRIDDEAASARITKELRPENVLAKLEQRNNDKDEEVMVAKFMAGEHWLKNDGVEQHKELGREKVLHDQSVEVLKQSAELQFDFEEHHVGQVRLPKETPKQERVRVEQGEFIDKIEGRMELFGNYKDYTVEVSRLNDCIWKQQREMAALEEELREGMVANDFEWQQERTAKIVQLRAKTEVDIEDLGYSERRLASFNDEISRKFPEMSSNIDGFNEGAPVAVEDEMGVTEVKEVEGAAMFDGGSHPVYAWLLGRLTHDGKICCMLFGQFSKEIEPPSEGWIYVGKNVDRNLLTTNQVANKMLDKSQDMLSVEHGGGDGGSSSSRGSKGSKTAAAGTASGKRTASNRTKSRMASSSSSLRSRSSASKHRGGGSSLSPSRKGADSILIDGSSMLTGSGIVEGKEDSLEGTDTEGIDHDAAADDDDAFGEGSMEEDDWDSKVLEQEPTIGDITSTSEMDHVLTEREMQVAAQDSIVVTRRKAQDGSHAATVAETKAKESIYYTVEGCSVPHLDGRYTDAGKACNVPKYRSTRGWVLYRCSLLEIPDLGIFADSCYDAFKVNSSVSDSLNKRADQAYADIVDRHNVDAPDGSVRILLYYCSSFLFLFVMFLSLSLINLLLHPYFSDMT
jgi:hypothetical protein